MLFRKILCDYCGRVISDEENHKYLGDYGYILQYKLPHRVCEGEETRLYACEECATAIFDYLRQFRKNVQDMGKEKP